MEGQIVKIGTVAAQNIVKSLRLPIEQAPVVEAAIADEINAMSAHFTLAFADVQTQYEAEVLKLKSTYRFVEEHLAWIIARGFAMMALGTLLGHYS